MSLKASLASTTILFLICIFLRNGFYVRCSRFICGRKMEPETMMDQTANPSQVFPALCMISICTTGRDNGSQIKAVTESDSFRLFVALTGGCCLTGDGCVMPAQSSSRYQPKLSYECPIKVFAIEWMGPFSWESQWRFHDNETSTLQAMRRWIISRCYCH